MPIALATDRANWQSDTVPVPGLTDDERQLLRSAQLLRLIRASAWPAIAAELLARGIDGDATTELAGLSATDSAWSIEPLVPDVLVELGGDAPDQDSAIRLVARATVQAAKRKFTSDPYPAIRALAALSPDLGYPPDGLVGEAWYLNEWLDCDCHEGSSERRAAGEFERAHAEERLDVNERFFAAVTSGWV